MEKEYSAKSKLTDSELTTLILLVRKIRKAAKEGGIEMSKAQAKRHALEHLGWTSENRIVEAETSSSFREGQRTANERFNKSN